MKRQLLVAQLAVLFEKSTAQHRLRRQTLPARLRDRLSARIGRHQTQKIAMGVQSLRHRLQLTTDLGLGEKIEYAALDGGSWRIVGSGGCGFVFISGLMLKCT
ncbi:hypothetical protein ACVMB3_004524 [Sinorhizobium meliloti]|nr:hypothetical protein SAMN04244576_06605 [Sinorhizobium meliloti]